MFDWLKTWFGLRSLSDDQFEKERDEFLKRIPTPVFWLFGKTGSGKTSIIRYLTGSTQAEIGNGFQPQTRTSFQYEFPNSEQPILKFLDTRGLGEAGYDPAIDLKTFDDSTHVVIVVARVMDHSLADIVAPLRTIRAARPTRPILLALTCLHEAYPFQQHPVPDPFDVTPPSSVSPTASNPALDIRPKDKMPAFADHAIPIELERAIREQVERFEGLVDGVVPIDFTRPEEGFDEPNFGGKRLELALIEMLPAACRQALLHLDDLRSSLRDLTHGQAMPTILTYSSLAAAAAAAPLPWVDIPIVMTLQTRLVYLLAELYDQKLNAGLLTKMAAAVGGRLALRFAVKAPLKFIPIVGQTANAAMAFAYTYSLGKACCWYFGEMKNGNVPSAEALDRVWSQQLQDAISVWKSRQSSSSKVATPSKM